MVHVPGPEWRALVELVDDAPSTADLVAAVYDVVGRELVAAYRSLVEDCDPLADEHTIRLVTRNLLPDHEERLAWATGFLAEHPADPDFVARVRAALDAAGGLV